MRLNDILKVKFPPMTWIKQNIHSALLVGVLLFQAGTLYANFVWADKQMTERVSQIESRLTHAENDLTSVQKDAADVYQRRDVLETRLTAIEFRLGKIETALERLRP